jgi:hypothetical protein
MYQQSEKNQKNQTPTNSTNKLKDKLIREPLITNISQNQPVKVHQRTTFKQANPYLTVSQQSQNTAGATEMWITLGGPYLRGSTVK